MKKLVLFVWIIFSFLPLEAEILSHQISPGLRNLQAIRVEFKEDTSPYTTGNGKFMITEWTGHDTTYILDALPHDRNYFKSHLNFINNYWDKASAGNIGINTDNAYLLPAADSAYTLSGQMRYYSDPDSLDYRLAELVYESVMKAVNAGEFLSNNDGVIIYHAGAGQDFKIDLDNSPFDIPSFYFDQPYLSEYLSYDEYQDLLAVNCTHGIVLPESQNQLSVNIALNGTEILLTGMLLGLPTLYDTEFGRSGAGTYGLMDQGSNAGSGLCPIKPSAYERYLLGAVEPITLNETQNITMLRDEVYKLPISSNEYFLVEFRKNAGMWADSLLWSRDDISDYLDVLRVFDSLGYVNYTLENGVLTDLSDLDITLPTNGLLIWHIVEPEVFGENPNAQDDWFLNLVEADGGDDIGKWYNTFDQSVNNGWKWDMWFDNNPAFKDNNPASYKLQFNDSSHPSTRSKAGLSSGININDLKFYADSAVIQLIVDSPTLYNFPNMVFDEMTRAAGAFDNMNNLIGYRDSSLYFFNSMGNFRLFANDAPYTKDSTAIMTYGSDIIQIVNTATSAKIKHLVFNPTFLIENNTMDIGHPLDLEHIAIHDDTLFLPPVPIEAPAGSDVSSQPREVYKLDVASWTLIKIDETISTLVPYVESDMIKYIESDAAALINGDLIYSDTYGFCINGDNPGFDYLSDGQYFLPDYMPTYTDMHKITQILPLHLNSDGEYEILALTEFEGNTTLAAFSQNGPLLNNYPIFEDYTKIRVLEGYGSPEIVAYNPAGVIDIYSVYGGDLSSSLPAPVNATSFFIEQVTADTAWIVVDGSVIPISSSGVYWGYNGKNAVHSNSVMDIRSGVPLGSDQLTAYSIYNYPNPIEGARTKFRFFSTGATHATVTIYSLDGRFIAKLEHDVVDQQWNEIPWFVLNEESGVYLAKIEITDGTITETHFVKPAILK